MTAIVGVLNSHGIAIAADSAVTVTGNKVKKVYNRSNKVFTLSKIHPVGIAIYSSADFMGIPLETIIKLYRKKLKDKSFNSIEEYKIDFLEFLKTQIAYVSPEFKWDRFYTFCSESYIAIKDKIIANLEGRAAELEALTGAALDAAYDGQVSTEINNYLAVVDGLSKADYVNTTSADFTAFYNDQLATIVNFIQDEVQKQFPTLNLKQEHISGIQNVMFSLINVEFCLKVTVAWYFLDSERKRSIQQLFRCLSALPLRIFQGSGIMT